MSNRNTLQPKGSKRKRKPLIVEEQSETTDDASSKEPVVIAGQSEEEATMLDREVQEEMTVMSEKLVKFDAEIQR